MSVSSKRSKIIRKKIISNVGKLNRERKYVITTAKKSDIERLIYQQQKTLGKSGHITQAASSRFLKGWTTNIYQALRFQYWLIKNHLFRVLVIFIVFGVLLISIFIISLLPSIITQFKRQLLEGYEPFVGHLSYERSDHIDLKNNLVDRYLSYDKNLPSNSNFINYKGFQMLNNFHLFANPHSGEIKTTPGLVPSYSNVTVTGQTFATFNYDIKPQNVINKVSDAVAKKYIDQNQGWMVGAGRTIQGNSRYIYNEKVPNSLNMYELFTTNSFVNNVVINGETYSGFNAFWLKGKDHKKDIQKLSQAVISIYTSFDSTIAFSGVGGLTVNNFIISQLSYLDGVSYLLKKHYNLPIAYDLSRKTSSLIAGILLRPHAVLDSQHGHKIFDKYVKDSNIDINLLFASFLSDIVNFFTPLFIGRVILNASQKIKDDFVSINKQMILSAKSASAVTIDSDLWITNLVKNKKFKAGESYSFNFGSIPFDPKSDELYTHLFDTHASDGKTVSFDGYRDNSRFWGLHPQAQSALFENGAFAPFSQHTKLKSGLNAASAIPIVINRSAYYDHHNWRVDHTIKLNTEKIGFKIPKKSSNAISWATNFKIPIYCQIVGITSNYGVDEIYTSRQEANNFVFQKISDVYNNQSGRFEIQPDTDNNGKSIYIYGIPSQPDPRGQPNYAKNIVPEMLSFETKNAVTEFPQDDHNNSDGSAVGYSIQHSVINNNNRKDGTASINSSIYGDGFGYYNSVNFTSDKSIDAVNSVIVDFSGYQGANNFAISKVGSVRFDSANVFSKSILAAAVHNLIKFLLVIFLIAAFVIFFVILTMFIFNQKIFIEQNHQSFQMLKLLGYSTRNILLSTTVFYLASALVLSVTVLLMYKFFINILFSLISAIIPSALHIRFSSLGFSWTSFTIYIILIGFFLTFFISSSLNTIRKIKCVRSK